MLSLLLAVGSAYTRQCLETDVVAAGAQVAQCDANRHARGVSLRVGSGIKAEDARSRCFAEIRPCRCRRQ